MKKLLKYLGIILFLYVVYIVTGLFLLSSKRVTEWVVLPGKAIRNSDHDADYSKTDNDGPHIFYTEDKIYVKSVLNHDSEFFPKCDTFHITARKDIVVSCTFSEHPEWNFNTRLKDTLINEPVEYPVTDSLLAISDIEGNFRAFRNLLVANHVMSNDYKWTFGNGHLVLVGDIFDRGLNVTECLWLIYHLEQEAEKVNGKVHLILGNHEIMNLSGDLRYVPRKYIQNSSLINESYRKWFTNQTELGRWLQTKNIVEKIGTILFVHGGFSEDVNALKLSLSEINSRSRPWYYSADTFKKDNGNFLRELTILFKSKTSPFWYRGYVNHDASEEQVKQTLKQYDVSVIVTGHTVVPKVTALYNGKVIAIDTKHAEDISEGVIFIKGQLYKIDQSGKRYPL